MRQLTLGLVVCAALAGCAQIGSGARPEAVFLTRNDLVVSLTDGTRCRMERPAAAVWSGRLQGCSRDWPYEVALDPRTHAARQLVEAVFTQIRGLRSATYGTVTITDPVRGAQYVFVSPAQTAED